MAAAGEGTGEAAATGEPATWLGLANGLALGLAPGEAEASGAAAELVGAPPVDGGEPQPAINSTVIASEDIVVGLKRAKETWRIGPSFCRLSLTIVV
jgi:hypothetical protein